MGCGERVGSGLDDLEVRHGEGKGASFPVQDQEVFKQQHSTPHTATRALHKEQINDKYRIFLFTCFGAMFAAFLRLLFEPRDALFTRYRADYSVWLTPFV